MENKETLALFRSDLKDVLQKHMPKFTRLRVVVELSALTYAMAKKLGYSNKEFIEIFDYCSVFLENFHDENEHMKKQDTKDDK